MPPHQKRQKLSKRGKRTAGRHICPICGILVTPSTFEEHLAAERRAIAVKDGGHSVVGFNYNEREKDGDTGHVRGSGSGSMRGAAMTARINVLSQFQSSSWIAGSGDGEIHDFASRRLVDESIRRIRQRRLDRRVDLRDCRWYLDKLRDLDAGSRSPVHQVEPEVELAGGAVMCIVCGEQLFGDFVEVNRHVESCLEKEATTVPSDPKKRKSKSKKGKDRTPSAWSDLPPAFDYESYETYTIGGEERIRASSFLPSNAQALRGTGTVSINSGTMAMDEDVDVDIDIDDDGTTLHGQPQYTEAHLADVNVNVSTVTSDEVIDTGTATAMSMSSLHESKPRSAHDEIASLRSVIEALKIQIKTMQEEYKHSAQVQPTSISISKRDHHSDSVPATTTSSTSVNVSVSGEDEDEGEALVTVTRCHICLDRYRKPLVSINCWHTHCEQCWLRTLATKRLCPQCNVITSPTDLRRVYL